MWKRYLLLGYILLIAGCATSTSMEPFYTHIRKQNFEPFHVVQALNGPGAIISYVNVEKATQRWNQSNSDFKSDNTVIGGGIQVIRSPESWIPKKMVRSGMARIPDFTSSMLVDYETSLRFMKFPIGATLAGKKIQKVVIKFGKMHIEQIEIGRLKDFINSGQIDPGIREDATAPGNFIVYEAIKTNRITYVFLDDAGNKIHIDAQLIGSMLNSGKIETSYAIKENTTLVVNDPVYIGYKAIQIERANCNWHQISLDDGKSNAPSTDSLTVMGSHLSLAACNKFQSFFEYLQNHDKLEMVQRHFQNGSVFVEVSGVSKAKLLKWLHKGFPQDEYGFKSTGNTIEIYLADSDLW